MNCWELLGIPPTRDLEVIKAAFAAQSRLHHPEEDPDGFATLKSAYQQARSIASTPRLYDMKYVPETPLNLSGLQRPAASGDSDDSLVFRTLNSNQTAKLESETKVESTYSFSTAEQIEIPEDQYYNNAMTEQIKTHHKIEIKRRRAISARKLFPLLRILSILTVLIVALIISSQKGLFNNSSTHHAQATGYISLIPSDVDLSYTQVEKLQSQARVLLEDETENRRQTLDNIRENKAYSQCQSAAALQISADDYETLLETYRIQGEETVQEALDTYTQAEADFVRDKLLPYIKAGVMQKDGIILAVTLGSMVGLTYQDCFMLFAEFFDHGDEAKLDQALIRYKRLTPPDQWGFDMNST